MDNKKRVTLKCHNKSECGREYTLFQEFDGKPMLFVACPYCGAEGIVDLAPWRSQTMEILQGEGASPFTLETLDLPDVLPTEPLLEEG